MKKKILFLFVFLMVVAPLFFSFAQTNKIEINFFYSKYCSHCHAEKPFLEKLVKKYPQIELKEYEISSSPKNQKIFQEFAQKYNVDTNGVPVTFIGDKYVIGYDNENNKGKEIENYITSYIGEQPANNAEKKIHIPIIGDVNISRFSLPALTVILGTLDGFNPCSMWALIFLITLLLATKSRKRMLVVGGIFILVSSISYFLFMTAWLNLFLFIGFYSFIRILIGIVAIVIGAMRIRDFITFKPGTCKVTDEKEEFKGKIVKRMREVIKPSSLIATIAGVTVLAWSVNLVEFFCSAGFPAVYTNILSQSNLNPLTYYFYIILYVFFYMLDDLVVWLIALITFEKIALTDKYSKWAALIGGVLMVLLGAILILKPAWLMFA